MGRLFVTELDGPVYKCKYCQVDLAVYEPNHTKSDLFFGYPASYGKLYSFNECSNVVIGTEDVLIGVLNGPDDECLGHFMREVFCVPCGSLLGLCDKKNEPSDNEGKFYLNRYKIQGPPDGSDNEEGPGDV